MYVDEITVEVRSVALGRLGQIEDDRLTDLKLIKRFNNVGSWTMSLPTEYDLSQELRKPGRGIVVLGPNNVVFMSGSMIYATHKEESDDPIGTLYFQGVDDNIHLSDALAYPDPANDPDKQQFGYDVRVGLCETVIRQYVAYNIIPGYARPDRAIAKMVLDPSDLGRGAVVKGSARFDSLGKLINDLAVQGNLGFDIQQVNDQLRFHVYQPEDKSGTIRMDIDNDMLNKTEYGLGAPTATRGTVAGQGEGVERRIIRVTDPVAVANEVAWGRKPEVFKDRRDTALDADLIAEGTTIVAENGKNITSLSVVPADEQTMVYGKDWFLGDIVGVVVDGQELKAVVTESIITIDEEGVRTAATIGDPVGFDYESKLIQAQAVQESRLAFLEQNAEVGPAQRYGNIEPWYTDGPARVQFEGASAYTSDGLKWREGYTPVGGDRVLVSRIDDQWVIMEHAGTLTAMPFPRELRVKPILQNNWVEYSEQYYPRLSKTTSGIVALRGLVMSGTVTANTVLFRLPEGFRPDMRMTFPAMQYPNTNIQRIDVMPSGDVVIRGTGNAREWISLGNIIFPAAGVANWVNIPLYSGITTGIEDFPPLSLWKDPFGTVWARGMVSGGGNADNTPVAYIPEGYRPHRYHHLIGVGGAAANLATIGTAPASYAGLAAAHDSGTVQNALTKKTSAPNGGWVSYDGVMWQEKGTPGNYKALALVAPWVNYNTGGDVPYTSAQSFKRSDSLVLSRGLIKGGNINATIAPTPAGEGVIGRHLRATTSNAEFGRLDVGETEGWLPVYGSNVWYSLDGAGYIAER